MQLQPPPGEACHVLKTRSAAAALAAARDRREPVLACSAATRRTSGPIVVAAADAGPAFAAAHRLLGARDAIVIAGYDATPPTRAASYARRRHDALDRAERAAACASEFGIRVEIVLSADPDAAVARAVSRGGTLVLTDRPAWRGARAAGIALRGDRPVLVVPAADGREQAVPALRR